MQEQIRNDAARAIVGAGMLPMPVTVSPKDLIRTILTEDQGAPASWCAGSWAPSRASSDTPWCGAITMVSTGPRKVFVPPARALLRAAAPRSKKSSPSPY